MKQVRITVLRKQMHQDLAAEYLTGGPQPCDFYEEGQVFFYEGGAEMPKGFCPWAWVDIYPSVNALSLGASCAPWQKRAGVNVVCCTDGIRPVSFLLEAVEVPAPPG